MGEGSIFWTRPPGSKPGGCHVCPGFAIVAGDVEQAIVRTGPDDARLCGRFANGVDGAVDFLAGGVARDGFTAGGLRSGRLGGEIGTDALPMDSAIVGAVNVL